MKNLLTFILLLTAYTALAQNIPAGKEKTFAKRPLTFTENKGQITDQYGHARHDIQYKTGGAGMSVFIGNGQLHYQWSKALTKRKLFTMNIHSLKEKPDTTSAQYSMYRLDMALEGANPHAQAIAGDKQTFYENYHTEALHTGNTHACTYNKITYKNIYPHIDWTLYIKDNKLEYDFIVNPGGDVNDIKIKYNGATDIAHTEGNIKIITPLGDVKEQGLFAYEQATNKPIAAHYTCHNNTFGFKVDDDSWQALRSAKQPTIIIDPFLAWGTYYAGDGESVAMGTACDATGNVYITGRTSCTSNIATTGSYQTVFGGYEDVFLAKFGSGGNILWATYYGGDDQDNGYGVACDNAGNVYITGFTVSTNGIATPGAHQTVFGGGWDAYLAKFDSTGSIQWGTYYGGPETEQGWSVATDSLGHIYVCGIASSRTGITTLGSYQDTLGGVEDAFLAQFGANGVLLWGTYFGGEGVGDVAYSCVCDKAQYIYIAGGVAGNILHTTPGCYQDTNWVYGGGWDGFIAKFDSACHLQWSTYYGGDSGQNVQSIACDDSLNVYVTGPTFSTDGIATPGAYQTVYSGGNDDVFLAKFSDLGAIRWATYYGGTGDDEGQGVACDNLGHIFITGSTNSANGIATPGSFHDAYIGGGEAYLAEFSGSGALLWGAYYGGGRDGANGVACDNLSGIYIVGGTASDSDIATAGSYQSAYAGGSEVLLAKFDTSAPSAVVQMQQIIDAQLFPSPNNGNFTVGGECSNICNTVSIEIVNMAGQLIYQATGTIQNGQLYKEISLTGMTSGDYLMKLNGGNGDKTIKFTIQH